MKKKKSKVPLWMQFPKNWRDSGINDLPFTNISIKEIRLLLTNEQRSDPALEAVWKADLTASPDPIIDFLLSKNPLSPWGRKLIVDWRRRNTKGTPGRKKPIYVRYTSVQLASAIAVHKIKHDRGGMSQVEAIKRFADRYGMPESALAAAVRRNSKL